MKEKIVNIAEISDDNKRWNVEQMVESAIKQFVKENEKLPTSAVLLLIKEDSKGCKRLDSWYNVNISNEEQVFFFHTMINKLVGEQ